MRSSGIGEDTSSSDASNDAGEGGRGPGEDAQLSGEELDVNNILRPKLKDNNMLREEPKSITNFPDKGGFSN